MAVLYFPVSSSKAGRTVEIRGSNGYGTLDRSYIYGYTVYYNYNQTTNVRKLFCGDSKINSLRVGSSPVKQVYVGTKKVFGTETTTTKVYDYNLYPCYVYYV
jgi:hypothetical protein